MRDQNPFDNTVIKSHSAHVQQVGRNFQIAIKAVHVVGPAACAGSDDTTSLASQDACREHLPVAVR